MTAHSYRLERFNDAIISKMESGWSAEAHAVQGSYPYQHEVRPLVDRCRRSMSYDGKAKNAEYSFAVMGDRVDYPLAIVYMVCAQYGAGERRAKVLNIECSPLIDGMIVAGDIAGDGIEDPVQLLIDALHGAIDESFNGLSADTVKLYGRNNDLLTVLKATASVLQRIPTFEHDVAIESRWLVLHKKPAIS